MPESDPRPGQTPDRLLSLVAGQDVEPADDSDGRDGRWRITRGTVPDRTVSTVDPDAATSTRTAPATRTASARVAFEPEIGLFTAVALTGGHGRANHEATVAADLLTDEGGEPTVPGDSAYGTGELRESLRAAGHAPVIKPPPGRPFPAVSPPRSSGSTPPPEPSPAPPDTPSPSAAPTRTATARHSSRSSAGTVPCANAARSPRAGRVFTVHPRYDTLEAARRQAATDPDWQAEYRRWRPPVERSIAWLVARGNRTVPYRGVIADNTWLHHRAAALNLRRLVNLGLTHTDGTWHLAPTTA